MIYLDANVVIRLIEGAPAVRAAIAKRLRHDDVCTSQITRLECRSKPMADGNTTLLEEYDAFFGGKELLLCGLTIAIINEATELRAKHRLKSPDAIHLATSRLTNVTTFLTGDKNLARVTEVPVEIV